MAMMSLQHLQIVSTQIIKPSSPTPPNLNIHTLSLFDQLAPHTFVPLLFFFSHHGPSSGTYYDHTTVELLRQSLSTTLSRYYPLAGRIKDKVSIDCNDEGVTFVEARLEGVTVSKILENPRSEIVEKLFVDGLQWKDSKMGSLLKVQITLFECGGLSIGVLLSHKLGDLATLVKFIQDWGVITRNNGFCDEEEIINPLFFSGDLFPHGDLPAMSGAVIEEGNFTCKRFVFEGSKIESLKNRISEKVQNPSRVEVVSALIYKAIISASRTNNNSQNHPATLLLQTLNLRKRVAPPLPDTLVGSLVSFFPVGVDGEREVVELHELVGTMRKEMGEFCEKYAKKYRTKEWLELIKKRLNESREILSKNGEPPATLLLLFFSDPRPPPLFFFLLFRFSLPFKPLPTVSTFDEAKIPPSPSFVHASTPTSDLFSSFRRRCTVRLKSSSIRVAQSSRHSARIVYSRAIRS